MDGRERSSVVHAHVRVMKVEAATSKRVNVNARMNASSLINYLLKFLSYKIGILDNGRLCGLSTFSFLPVRLPISPSNKMERRCVRCLSSFFFFFCGLRLIN